MAVGDGVQQQLEFYKKIHKGEAYDWKRTGESSNLGKLKYNRPRPTAFCFSNTEVRLTYYILLVYQLKWGLIYLIVNKYTFLDSHFKYIYSMEL